MRGLLTLAAVALLFGLSAQPATGAPGPSPSPSPSPVICPSPSTPAIPTASAPASPAATLTPAAADLCRQRQLLEEVRQRLGSNLATALAVQDQLTQSLNDNARAQAEIAFEASKAQAQIRGLDDQLTHLAAEEARTRQRIDADRGQAAALARSAYFRPDSFLLELVSAGSLEELAGLIADAMAAGSRIESDERRLRSDQMRLTEERTAAATARAEKSRREDALRGNLVRLADLQRAQEESRVRLAAQIAQTRNEISRAEQQSSSLAQRISAALDAEQAEIIARAIQQVWAQVLLWEESVHPGSVPVSGGHSKTFRFVWPEPSAVISQGFGPSDLALEPSYATYPHFHTGLDLAAPALNPVLAADDGIVAIVGTGTTGYGNYVVLGHRGGLVTLYGHLHDALVKPGDSISQGQPIGLEGSTGNSTGPHVHFELRLRDQPIDPTPYLPPGAPSTFGLNGG